jgi:hypothetical protein
MWIVSWYFFAVCSQISLNSMRDMVTDIWQQIIAPIERAKKHVYKIFLYFGVNDK